MHQQGQHDFVVAGERVSCSSWLGWAFDDILYRTVVLDHVHVHSREIHDFMVRQVAGQIQGLEEYLRQNNCRADVQVDSTIAYVTEHRNQDAKIGETRDS